MEAVTTGASSGWNENPEVGEVSHLAGMRKTATSLESGIVHPPHCRAGRVLECPLLCISALCGIGESGRVSYLPRWGEHPGMRTVLHTQGALPQLADLAGR